MSETCSDENDVQLITGVIPETASASDSDAVRPMLVQLEANGLTPAQMTADTAYGSDENCVIAESFGVELIAPVPGRTPQVDPEGRTLDDFAHNEVTGSVDACPAGHAPLHVTRDETTHTTVVEMPAATCASCPLRNLCLIHQTPDGRYELKCTDQARRTAAPRCEEETHVFRERYAKRSGIESTNSGLKNRLGLGWLRVRGRGAGFRTILLNVTGWNVLRAAASKKLRTMVQETVTQLLGTGWAWPFGQTQVVTPSPASHFLRPRTPPNRSRRTFSHTAESFQFPPPLTA